MATARDLRTTHGVGERVTGVDDKIDLVIEGAYLVVMSIFH